MGKIPQRRLGILQRNFPGEGLRWQWVRHRWDVSSWDLSGDFLLVYPLDHPQGKMGGRVIGQRIICEALSPFPPLPPLPPFLLLLESGTTSPILYPVPWPVSRCCGLPTNQPCLEEQVSYFRHPHTRSAFQPTAHAWVIVHLLRGLNSVRRSG